MEPEQLRIFLAVAEHGSFTAAAKALFLSHSTTSRAVAALERELGSPLFLRQGRTVALTKAGETLRPEAERILGMMEEIKEKVKELGMRNEE